MKYKSKFNFSKLFSKIISQNRFDGVILVSISMKKNLFRLKGDKGYIFFEHERNKKDGLSLFQVKR
jgi:hypothetical protein